MCRCYGVDCGRDGDACLAFGPAPNVATQIDRERTRLIERVANLEEALREAGECREDEAYDAGFRDGYTEGRDAGYHAGRAEVST